MSENLLGNTGDGVGFRICNFTKKDYVAGALRNIFLAKHLRATAYDESPGEAKCYILSNPLFF